MPRAMDMDFGRGSAEMFRRDRVRDERVHQIIGVESGIVFDVMTKKLV